MITVNCSGLHCDGCGRGTGPGIGAAVVLVVLAAIVANARAIERTVGEVVHVLIVATLAAVALIVAGTVATLVIRHQRALSRARQARPGMAEIPVSSLIIRPVSRAAELPAGRGQLPPEPARPVAWRNEGRHR
jgi:hypothetical protein